MSEKMNIQWFPGHMTKARRMIVDSMKIVDAVCEIVDARIPYSSRNPDLDDMTGNKPRIIALNRVDQADPEATKEWYDYFISCGYAVIETDSKSGKGINNFSKAVRELLAERISYYISKGQKGRQLRVMVVGIPNVGKSSFINRVAKRKATQTSDRPGVTRGQQWINVDNSLELFDTPGILWPRFEDQTVAENLAFTGAIRDAIMDTETLAANLMVRMVEFYPERLLERYKIEANPEKNGFELLEEAAKKRSFLLPGGEYDINRMAVIFLDEFRGGKLGRVTLEYVNTQRDVVDVLSV